MVFKKKKKKIKQTPRVLVYENLPKSFFPLTFSISQTHLPDLLYLFPHIT